MDTLLAELDRLQREFDQVRTHLSHSHRLATLGTLTSAVAHEYNNLLTPVINYAQMALSQPEDPELTRKALEKALDGAQRATQISASLLGFSRAEDHEAAAHLPQTIDEAISCLARDPAKEGVELRVDVPDVSVAMAPLNLEQVLINLVLNAKKAMRRTGGRLDIRGHIDRARQAAPIVLEVADTGPGIPAGVREQLFEPFVTEPAAPPEPGGSDTGTGLGLSICRDLVQAAGGSIEVTTSKAGTTFLMHLPRAAASEAPQREEAA